MTLPRGRWAPWLHAVIVAVGAAGTVAVTVDPRYAWIGALLGGISKTAGSAIGTFGVPRPPLTPRELVAIAQDVHAELHRLTQKVSTLLAEAELMADRLERDVGRR